MVVLVPRRLYNDDEKIFLPIWGHELKIPTEKSISSSFVQD